MNYRQLECFCVFVINVDFQINYTDDVWFAGGEVFAFADVASSAN